MKDNDVQVEGLGTWDYKQLQDNVRRKLSDLAKLNSKGSHHKLGLEDQRSIRDCFRLLKCMWEALSNYEHWLIQKDKTNHREVIE
jgi:hypothetical protein